MCKNTAYLFCPGRAVCYGSVISEETPSIYKGNLEKVSSKKQVRLVVV